MNSRSQNRNRANRTDVEPSRPSGEPYAILWLDNREICLYDEDDAQAAGERHLN